MGRVIRTLENRTVLVFMSAALLLCGAVFAISLWTMSLSEKQARIDASDRMLAAAGRLSQNTAASDEQIASAFAAKSTDEAKLGEKILSVYGYEAGTGRGTELAFTRSYLPCAVASLGVLACALLGYFCFRRMLTGVGRLTTAAEKKEKCLDELSDRDLSLLAEQINKLISERERSEKQLLSEKVYLAQYLQDFSHQIKTPTAGLTLNNEIYRSHPMSREEMSGYLDRDSICIERINRLCSESLKLARLETSAVGYNVRPCSLARIVSKACAPLHELAAANGTRIETDIADSITLACDELWLCEAVSNLVKNSCEHTKNGSVCVTAKQTPLSAELVITDNGEGISDEDIPQIFRRFYSKRSERDPVAVGIGMSIAKRITEDMGGKLYIKSEVGRGTQIRLEFLQ